MSLRQIPFIIALGVFAFMAPLPADAAQKVSLNDAVKNALIAAKSVHGSTVDQNAFDGRPVLVSFFASW